MSLWQEIITTALVGTERRTLSPTPPTDQLSNLLCQLDYSDPEGALLAAAAAISLHQQAGQLPLTDNQPLPEPCPPEELPLCSPRAAQLLRLMMLERREKLLPEWLALAATAGVRAPDYNLPELLELGRTSRQLRPAILAVLGQRGRWLAAQNPDWDYGVGENIEETWTTGSTAARQLLLQDLRTANPTAARERLVGVWGQEKLDERLAFLATFEIGLSLDDEPFLEAALDDKRKEVRQKAVQLLSQLPESRLCQRMTQRVRTSLILAKKRNRLHLDFTLPETRDETLTRDGIETKKPPHLLGEKAWQILQMVAATPLSVWYSLNGEPPTAWIQAAKRSEWDRTLIEGWAVAALRQENSEWAEVLLPFHGNFNSYLVPQDQLTQGLIGVLSSEERDTFFLKLLKSRSEPLSSQHPVFPLLGYCRYPWSVQLTRAVIDGVRRYLVKTQNPYDWSLRSALQYFAYYMHPSLVPEISATLTAVVPKESSWAFYWIEAIDECLRVLELRHKMNYEL